MDCMLKWLCFGHIGLNRKYIIEINFTCLTLLFLKIWPLGNLKLILDSHLWLLQLFYWTNILLGCIFHLNQEGSRPRFLHSWFPNLCLFFVLPWGYTSDNFQGGYSKTASCFWSPVLQQVEKEMATHCSSLAWRIPWTSLVGYIQSRESQRVGFN